MKNHIKLMVLGLLLFTGASLYADDVEKGAEGTPATSLVSQVVSKSCSFVKDAAGNTYVRVGASLVAVGVLLAAGCYVYNKIANQKTTTELIK